jgi:hypothetical protein
MPEMVVMEIETAMLVSQMRATASNWLLSLGHHC